MPFRFLAVTGLLLAGCLVSWAADAEPTVDFPKLEKEVLELTNAARAKEKLPPLKMNETLCKMARAHSANMARKKIPAGQEPHILDGKNTDGRADDAGYDFAELGENLGSYDFPKMPPIFDVWMKSAHHRPNILSNKYEEIGIGIAHLGNGRYYVTQDFGTQRKK